jgi:ribosomal protein L7/L12
MPLNNEEIVSLLRQGRKIEAVKIYRERTNLGLKEAQDAVEALERQI